MKLITIFFATLLVGNSIFITCSQPAQHCLVTNFTWTNNKKNAQNQELPPDQNFANLNSLIKILACITMERPAQNHWIFSSTNMPNFKRLKVQKTDPATHETHLVTYAVHIPADNNSHLNTSIWGFHPYITRDAHIGVTPYTATHISQIFVQSDTQTSRALMPIIHCITTATFTYAPPQPIPVSPLPTNDNRYTDGFEFVNDDPNEPITKSSAKQP